jgi:epsilon-lactone hydrolase
MVAGRAVILTALLDALGGFAKVDVWHGMPHGFLSGVGKLAAANQARAAIGSFLAQRLSASTE